MTLSPRGQSLEAVVTQCYITVGVTEEAVTEAFPDVLSARVYSIDQQPGQSLDRSYPRLWVLPPNLFLHYYPWYWPSFLPKPSDLGQEAIRSHVQSVCDTEAHTLQLRPVQC
jgi:hypothetical protein